MSSLLVVDWDYFFPNPAEASDPTVYPHAEQVVGTNVASLFDWAHAETPLFLGPIIWADRAATFLSWDLPLPTVNDQWRTFASRFQLTDSAMLYVADSNSYAPLALDSEGECATRTVLFDAHHDAGYRVQSLDQWRAQFDEDPKWSCEDWMLVQSEVYGSELVWRWPDWHGRYRNGDLGIPDGAEIDAAIDDGQPWTDDEFDAVFICRSGAWTPPWTDPLFADFLDTWPINDSEHLDSHPTVRPWGEAEQEHVDTLVSAMRQAWRPTQSTDAPQG